MFCYSQNVFWGLHGVDIYGALSWDRLHAYHGGLFSDHILGEIRLVLAGLPGRVEADVDEAYVPFKLFRISTIYLPIVLLLTASRVFRAGQV